MESPTNTSEKNKINLPYEQTVKLEIESTESDSGAENCSLEPASKGSSQIFTFIQSLQNLYQDFKKSNINNTNSCALKLSLLDDNCLAPQEIKTDSTYAQCDSTTNKDTDSNVEGEALDGPASVLSIKEESLDSEQPTLRNISAVNVETDHNKASDFSVADTIQKTDVENDCLACNQKFSSVLDLKLHLQIHHNEQIVRPSSLKEPFVRNETNGTCELSNISENATYENTILNQNDVLIEEDLTTDEKKFIICNICNFITDQKALLNLHIKCHLLDNNSIKREEKANDINNPVTLIDSQSGKNQSNARSEFKIDLINDGVEKCHLCDYVDKTEKGLRQHVLKMHKINGKFNCALCDETFFRKRNIIRHHMRFHTQLSLIYCYNCKFSTKYKTSIENHMQLHTKVFSHGCSLCDFRTSTKEQVNLHMKRSHLKVAQRCCQFCDFKTNSTTRINLHIRRHTGEKPFICNVCGKRFISSTRLNVHLNGHSNEKPFICGVCDYRARDKPLLRSHMSSHILEYPFVCSECDFKTKTKVRLNNHMRKHTGEVHYHTCKTCNFRTTHRAVFTAHMKKHSNPIVFSCPDCNYTTTHEANFGLHRRRHTGVGLMTCFNCKYSTTHRSNFINHVSKTCPKVKLMKKIQKS